MDPLSEIPEEFESLVLVGLALEGVALVVDRGRHKPSGPEQTNWDVTQQYGAETSYNYIRIRKLISLKLTKYRQTNKRAYSSCMKPSEQSTSPHPPLIHEANVGQQFAESIQ